MEHKSNKLCVHYSLRELKRVQQKCSLPTRRIKMFNLTNIGTS